MFAFLYTDICAVRKRVKNSHQVGSEVAPPAHFHCGLSLLQVFIGFVLKQFEYIEVGQFR